MRPKFNTIKIGKLVGSLYVPTKVNNIFIIHLKGGPSFADYGNSPFKALSEKYGFILFVPDYLGYCRSGGSFNFENCLKTVKISESLLNQNSKILKKYVKSTPKDNFQTILIGSSWGGSIAPLYFKFYKTKIKTLCLFRAVLDWRSQGNTRYKEDNPNDIIKLINRYWLEIYRGFSESDWPQIMKGKNKHLNPLDNVDYLKKVTTYITHGMRDKSINWRKSKLFFDNLKKINDEAKLKLFKNHGHSDESNTASLEYVLKDLLKAN